MHHGEERGLQAASMGVLETPCESACQRGATPLSPYQSLCETQHQKVGQRGLGWQEANKGPSRPHREQSVQSPQASPGNPQSILESKSLGPLPRTPPVSAYGNTSPAYLSPSSICDLPALEEEAEAGQPVGGGKEGGGIEANRPSLPPCL